MGLIRRRFLTYPFNDGSPDATEEWSVIAKIVLMYLTVYNCDTGAVLYQSAHQMPVFSVSGDRLEDCRQQGVSQADALTARYRKAYPHASTNVVCRWERQTKSI